VANCPSTVPTPTAALGPRWYAVQARPKQERRAALNLDSSDLVTFLPMVREVRRVGHPLTAPLFPGYLFVHCDIGSCVQRIRYTRGVAKVVGTGEGPTALDDAIIDCIQSRVGKDGFVELIDVLEHGDSVEIAAGPLKGLIGVFHSATSAAQRVTLLLTVAHTPMRIVLESESVKRASA
jgi:transcriptional antiterminator RfaH